ncbi:deoxyribonuclease [Bifidobacterium ramosum]|nr:deoxyribonuclease [Bifidobacterium ramosum]
MNKRIASIAIAALSVMSMSIVAMPASAAQTSLHDINNGTPHYEDVRWLVESGISTGWNDGTFRGMNSVTRQDMAAFLHRLAGSPNVSGTNPFKDVTSATPHYADIIWLASTGISTGWSDGTFRGMKPVTRQDMAAFLHRFAAQYPSKTKLVANTAVSFADVTDATPHAADIRWLASTGVTTGWKKNGRTEYRGMNNVVRQDMAAFLHRMTGAVDGMNATTALATLPVKGRAPKTGYSRDQFGAAWADVDHNGCDTRNDILARDLTGKTFKENTNNCVVASGTLRDPYTGKTIAFQRGQITSTAVQIDHVVALSDAWQTGAQQLPADRRRELANDPYNLLAVDGPANQQKSDGDAATWLPGNKSFRCEYVARQIGVKSKYSLWITQAEHDAMAGVLSSCPSQTVPDNGGVKANQSSAQTSTDPVTKPQSKPTTKPSKPTTKPSKPSKPSKPTTKPSKPSKPTTKPSKPTTKPSKPTTKPSKPSTVYYKNCAAVRAAGKAPLYRGQPGYRPALDRDKDGIACE